MSDFEELIVEVKKLKCKRCGYEWYPRPGRGLPKVCGHCKSFNWMKTSRDKKQEAA